MWWVPLATAGAQAVTQERTNRNNSREANKTRSHDVRMMQNKYQWQMQDMEKAGLNPILAGNLGASASNSGAQAQMQNPLGGAMEGVSTAMQFKKQKEEINLLKEQQKQVNQATAHERVKTRISETQVPKREIIEKAYSGAKSVLDNAESNWKKNTTKKSQYKTKYKAKKGSLYEQRMKQIRKNKAKFNPDWSK